MRIYRFLRGQPGLENLTSTSPRSAVYVRAVRSREKADHRPCQRAIGRRDLLQLLPDRRSPPGRRRDRSAAARGGTFPTITRGAMLPSGSASLLAAGRCIAGDREANSAYRVQASCMATGQAAGAMAALSATSGVEPGERGHSATFTRRCGRMVP